MIHIKERSNKMKIGVTGATGHLGRIVLAKLKKKVSADHIVAFARSSKKATEPGIETRIADYEDPESLVNSLKGIETLLLISGNEIGRRAIQHKNVIEAAKKAGVNRIIYTSLLHADHSTLSLAGEHYETEVALKESGIVFTILRNGWYTENYTGSIGGALAGGAFLGSAGSGRISSAARADYADAAVSVLTGEGHQMKTYELAGDSAYTLEELALEISSQTGKVIPYKNLPENEFAIILKDFGIPEVYASAIASWDVSASKGDLFDGNKQLSKLIGHPTTPLSDLVSEVVNGQ